MKERKSYSGTLKGISGIWVDKAPKGIKNKVTNIFYIPDEGKIFKKDDELFSCIVISEGIDINDYEEVDILQENFPKVIE